MTAFLYMYIGSRISRTGLGQLIWIQFTWVKIWLENKMRFLQRQWFILKKNYQITTMAHILAVLFEKLFSCCIYYDTFPKSCRFDQHTIELYPCSHYPSKVQVTCSCIIFWIMFDFCHFHPEIFIICRFHMFIRISMLWLRYFKFSHDL